VTYAAIGILNPESEQMTYAAIGILNADGTPDTSRDGWLSKNLDGPCGQHGVPSNTIGPGGDSGDVFATGPLDAWGRCLLKADGQTPICGEGTSYWGSTCPPGLTKSDGGTTLWDSENSWFSEPTMQDFSCCRPAAEAKPAAPAPAPPPAPPAPAPKPVVAAPPQPAPPAGPSAAAVGVGGVVLVALVVGAYYLAREL